MAEVHDYSGFAIENMLYPRINAINLSNLSPEKKAQEIEDAFKNFLEEAKNFTECSGLQRMTLEQLKSEYERLVGNQKGEER